MYAGKALHVIPSISPVHGGPSRAMAVMERALVEAGASVTTLTTDDDGLGERLARNAQLISANGARRVYIRKRFDFYKVAPGIIPWLWRRVRDYDVVHIHALFSFTSVTAALIARARSVPYTYIIRPLGTLTTYGDTQRRPWLKLLSFALIEGPVLRHAAAVRFTSRCEQEEARHSAFPCGALLSRWRQGRSVQRSGHPLSQPSGVGIADEAYQAGAAMVAAPEPKAIAAAIVQAFDNSLGRRHVGELAREWAAQKYSTAAMVAQLIDLYASIAQTQGTSPTMSFFDEIGVLVLTFNEAPNIGRRLIPMFQAAHGRSQYLVAVRWNWSLYVGLPESGG